MNPLLIGGSGVAIASMTCYTGPMQNKRLLRIPLESGLIDKMDELIRQGAGGLKSREQFVHEALDAMVLELRFDGNSEEPSSTFEVIERTEPGALGKTALPSPERPAKFLQPSDERPSEPLFGLHNRDYPSLWAAGRLCDLAGEGPVSFEPTLKELVSEAWDVGARMKVLDETVSGKPSALFPTNSDKRQAAEDAFLGFAVGSLRKEGGRIEARGPLFEWGVLALDTSGDEPRLGLTEAGYDLLRSMAGLTVSQPHPEEYASAFLGFLKAHAQADWEAFALLIRAIAEKPTRSELAQTFGSNYPTWKKSEAETNSAGYVARSREWGLVSSGQIEGRYSLTEFGEEFAA
ncbi:MAG: hypothetical protein R2706_20695 [Acidimicrobiales bacterium]